MKTVLYTLFALFLLVGASATHANAHEVKVGEMTITHPWARASAGMAKAGAAFMTIVNAGASDKLLSAAAEVSDVVELHTHVMEGSVMRMRQVPDIEVAGGSETALQPGGYHVMLIGLKAPLKEGDTFPLTLTFEKAGSVTVPVVVEAAGAMGGAHSGHGAGMPAAPAAPSGHGDMHQMHQGH